MYLAAVEDPLVLLNSGAGEADSLEADTELAAAGLLVVVDDFVGVGVAVQVLH